MASDPTEEDGGEPTDLTRREGKGTAAPRPRAEHARLSRGTLVGRYVILDEVGAGGMGVVYAAYDPELDRKVAVKLLQARGGGSASGGEPAWLLREAQAMARVTHPNVIAVFDVGTMPGDRVFVAMELVDGQTLRAWLKQRRPWREVVAVMRAAGAGLAAAHAAGLVHRDFKPDNVLVGKDGRVRVMDFGLARLRRDDDEPGEPAARTSDLQIEVKSPLSQDLTAAGHVPGTPAYMAPEITAGQAADARTDQFAFGVALYEALYGKRPYANGAKQPAPPPADARVPARVQRVAMRAIAPDPAARFASMDALLAELARDPAPARRRALLGAAGALVIAGATGAVVASRGHTAAAPPTCSGAEHRLAGVWDEPTKGAIRAAFLATKRPFAARSYDALAHALDGYTQRWTAAVTDACEATRVRGEQSEDVMSLREGCLDQRLVELGAVTKLLGSADADLVEKADRIAYGLQPLEACSNAAALRSPDALPTEPRAKVRSYQTDLATARAQLLAGHLFPALNAAQGAERTARELGSPAMIVEPEMVRGSALAMSGSLDDSIAAFRDATFQALAGKHDELAGEAALAGASSVIASGHVDGVDLWLTVARAELQRAGIDHALEQRRLEIEGFLAAQRHDLPRAIEMHRQALEQAELALGPGSPALALEEGMYGGTLAMAGRYGDALPHLQRALALREQAIGPDHPEIAVLLTNLGVAYKETGQLDQARAAYDRALAIREKEYGKDSPLLVSTINNQADALRLGGQPEAALELIERARAIAVRVPGEDHPLTQTVETTYGETLTSLGRYPEARAMFDELLAREARTHSPVLPTTQASRAQLAVDEKDWPAAVRFAQASVAGFEAVGGKDDGDLWRPLTALGQAQLALGHAAEASAALDRAIAIGSAVHIGEHDLAPAREARARIP